MSLFNTGLVLVYFFIILLFTNFSFFDPEYFLFFSSTALFFSISSFINSFLESAISAKYDNYIVRLEKVTLNLDEMNNFLSNLENSFFSNLETFFLLSESKLLSLNDSFSELFTDEFEEILFENFHNNELMMVSDSILISSNFFNQLDYSEFHDSLIFFIIQNPWSWKRRPRANRSVAFNKYFKTPKKFPAVAWPLKPGEYKLPRDWIDI